MSQEKSGDSRTLRIAVRNLVEYTLRSGDLELDLMGTGRPLEGIRMHQQIQARRGPEYAREVPVSLTTERGGFSLTVCGRIDGVWSGPEGTGIEEIKTTRRGLEDLLESDQPMHWGQAQVYAYLYCRQCGLSGMEVRLTYGHLDTGKARSVTRHFSIEELEAFFFRLLDCYLPWARELAQWAGLRDRSLAELGFPHAGFRPGQRHMAVAVYRRIGDGGSLLVQAPTGIGKTLAALFPALKRQGEGRTDKIFYLTARTPVRAVAEAALDSLRPGGMRLKSLTLTAKEKICFQPEAACNGEECEFARGYFDRLHDAVSEAFSRDAWTRGVVEEIARHHRICPFEFSLELSLWSDLVVCDYNYAFDPRVHLRRFFAEETGSYVFLVDEAHNLVDRSREMFSAELSLAPFQAIRSSLRSELPGIYRRIGRIASWLKRTGEACPPGGDAITLEEPPKDLVPMLRRFLSHTEKWLALNRRASFRRELSQLYFSVHAFLRIYEQVDGAYATCMNRSRDGNIRLKLFCLDPSERMRDALRRCRSAVFFPPP